MSHNIIFGADRPHQHMPLDLDFNQSHALLQKYKLSKISSKEKMHPAVAKAIAGGEKFLTWLKKINRANSKENDILLTSKTKHIGIPITKPKKYGIKLIIKQLTQLKEKLNPDVYEVVFGDKKITNNYLIDKKDFIKQGRLISSLYQIAVRWQTVIVPHKDYYNQNRYRDVRGFYALKNNPAADRDILKYNALTPNLKNKYFKELIAVCINYSGVENEKTCKKEFKNFNKEGKLLDYKNFFMKHAQKVWDSYFKIRKPRTDVVWNSSNPYILEVPFSDIKDSMIANWLKENVENIFKNEKWGVNIKFKKQEHNTAFLMFKPGVNPHVIKGNIIVMDKNVNILEPRTLRTIAHEFGHILRLPDCYAEFYDPIEDVAINYQLDTTDMMCSGAGEFTPRMYQELKRVYYKQ